MSLRLTLLAVVMLLIICLFGTYVLSTGSWGQNLAAVEVETGAVDVAQSQIGGGELPCWILQKVNGNGRKRCGNGGGGNVTHW